MEKQLTFEEALEQLEVIVKKLESGDLSLADSLAKYQEGMKLAKYCHEQIQNAETIIVKMMKGDLLEDFDINEE